MKEDDLSGDALKAYRSILKAGEELQDSIAAVDLLGSGGSGAGTEFLVLKRKELQIRMDTNSNHARPHVHITIGKSPHAASYMVDTGEWKVGSRQYQRQISAWIRKHRASLEQLWIVTRNATPPSVLIAHLRAGNF